MLAFLQACLCILLFQLRRSVIHLNRVSVQATSLRTKLHNGFCSFTSKVLEPPMDVQFMGRAVPYAFKFNGILWFELFFPSGTAMALCFCSKKGEKKFNSGFFHPSEATWGITEHLHENEHLERKTVCVL